MSRGVAVESSLAIEGKVASAAKQPALKSFTARNASSSPGYTRSSLAYGREMHKDYKLGEAGLKEFRLPSGRRVDFLDPVNGYIYELKPNNPRSIAAGNKQLDLYLEEIESMPRFEGIKWKTILETY